MNLKLETIKTNVNFYKSADNFILINILTDKPLPRK